MHTITPHKEFRFIFPVFYIFVILIPLAFHHLIQFSKYQYQNFLCILFTLLFLTTNCVAFWQFQDEWSKNSEQLKISVVLGRIPGIKKAVIFGIHRFQSGGYAYFHQNANIECIPLIEKAREKLIQIEEKKLPETYVAIPTKDLNHFIDLLGPFELFKSTASYKIFTLQQPIREIPP
jgi:hypothetical protein